MNLVDKITKKQIRTDLPEFRVGDTVRVDVWIKEGKKESPYYGMIIPHMIDPVCWDEKKLEMTQSRDQWLVSNTIKYWGTTIGNFEVHLTRTSFKFRFDIERLVEFFEPEFKEKIILN